MSRVHGWFCRAWGLGVFLAAATAAAAESTEADEPCPPPTESHWYGWQTLATDGAGIGLIVFGGTRSFEGPVAVTAASVGTGSLFLGGPIVHLSHGRWPIAILDLGMRLTLPIVGGYLASTCTEGECGGAFLAGFMIGVSPIWLDAGLLAREDKAKRPLEAVRRAYTARPPRALARLGVSELHPMPRFTKRGIVLGVGGTF